MVSPRLTLAAAAAVPTGSVVILASAAEHVRVPVIVQAADEAHPGGRGGKAAAAAALPMLVLVILLAVCAVGSAVLMGMLVPLPVPVRVILLAV